MRKYKADMEAVSGRGEDFTVMEPLQISDGFQHQLAAYCPKDIPWGATGVANLCELSTQLRSEADCHILV